MQFEKFKTKDFVLLGIITATYMVLYLVVNSIGQMLPLIGALAMNLLFMLAIGGVIIVFLINKIPKLGILTLFSLIMMLLFTLVGASYLPWFISLTITAILADILANSSKYQSKIKNAISYGLMQVGNFFGEIIPIWFFADQFVAEWTQRGMKPEAMQEHLNFYGGISGVIILAIIFACGFFGILLGHKILAKHFAKQD